MRHYEGYAIQYEEAFKNVFCSPQRRFPVLYDIDFKNFIRYVLCRTFNALPPDCEHKLFHPTIHFAHDLKYYYYSQSQHPAPKDPYSYLNAYVLFFICYKHTFELLFNAKPIISWVSMARLSSLRSEELQFVEKLLEEPLKPGVFRLRGIHAL